MTDTKAEWNRRALRAESELNSLKNIRMMEHEMEFTFIRKCAVLEVALNEIWQIVHAAKNDIEALDDTHRH